MKIKQINDREIIFDNGYILDSFHDRDCCEDVYADFEILKTYNVSTKTGKTINIKDIEFEEYIEKIMEKVEDAGFNLISKIGEKFFVPCYNDNNGYYSNEIILRLKKGEITVSIDITGCTKDI